jgi:hypothetical protein
MTNTDSAIKGAQIRNRNTTQMSADCRYYQNFSITCVCQNNQHLFNLLLFICREVRLAKFLVRFSLRRQSTSSQKPEFVLNKPIPFYTIFLGFPPVWQLSLFTVPANLYDLSWRQIRDIHFHVSVSIVTFPA